MTAKEPGTPFFYATDKHGNIHRHGGTRHKFTHCALVHYEGNPKPTLIWTTSLLDAAKIAAACERPNSPVTSVEVLEVHAGGLPRPRSTPKP